MGHGIPGISGGSVRFGGKMAAVIGTLGGVAVAAGLPAVILVYGANLGVTAQVTIIILALLLGATITAASAVLGIVIPTSAAGGGKMHGAFTINVGGKKKDKDEEEDKEIPGEPAD